MRIVRLQASNVRRIRGVALVPGPHLNIVEGANGSGKTSLLEAIHLLSSGRSFRTRRVTEVVTHGAHGLTAFCELRDREGARSHIGVEKAGNTTRVRVNGDEARVTSALARLLPTVLIGPDCARLLEESAMRRRVLDWVLFHVEPQYLESYQRFHRALRQRNAALRSGAGLGVWDRQLADAGTALHALRAGHAPQLGAFASRFLVDLLPIEVEIRYRPGWDVARCLLDVLLAQRETDRGLGYTRLGPQRADLRLTVRGSPARTVLSRGESKLLAMGVQLAQSAYFAAQRGEPPVLLVDDLGTELDAASRRRFLRALESLAAQAFVTTVLDQPREWFLDEVRESDQLRRFHVEQGSFRQVV